MFVEHRPVPRHNGTMASPLKPGSKATANPQQTEVVEFSFVIPATEAARQSVRDHLLGASCIVVIIVISAYELQPGGKSHRTDVSSLTTVCAAIVSVSSSSSSSRIPISLPPS